jgi:hypothetical protein
VDGAVQRSPIASSVALAAITEIVSHDRYTDVPTRTIDGCSVARVTGLSVARIESSLRPVIGLKADSVLATACDAQGRRQGLVPLHGWRLDSLLTVGAGPTPNRVVATLWDGSLVYQRRYRLGARGSAVVVRAHEDSGWYTVDEGPVIITDSSATPPPR